MKKAICLLLALLLAGCAAAPATPTAETIPDPHAGLSFDTAITEPVKYGAVAEVYFPETKLVNPPTVVQYITADTGLPQPEKTPAVCILPINWQMQVVDGDKTLINVHDFLALYRDRIIPAFLIDNMEEADALIGFLRQNKLTDAYVLAPEAQAHLVRYVRENYQVIQGALWVESISDRKEALTLANTSLSAVICTPQAMSPEDMQWFNSRMLSVWCCADSDASLYTAVASGWNGIIHPQPTRVMAFYERFTEPTVCGKSIPVGHRGVYGYLENTVHSLRLAMEEHGCTAVELDLRLSADGQIVIMHDATVDRTTNGSGKVSGMTLEQLKELQVTIGSTTETAPIPTFREVLEAFAGTDLVLVCHINVYSDALMQQFGALIEEFGCQDQIIAFLEFGRDKTYNYRNCPAGIGFAAGTEESLLETASDEDLISRFQHVLLPNHMQPLFYSYNSDADDGYIHGKPNFYYEMCARGFLNWHSTTTGNISVDSALLITNGAAAALLNDLTISDGYFYYLQGEDITISAGVPLPETMLAIGQTKDSELPCTYLKLDGTPLEKADLSAGTVTVVATAQAKTTSNKTYRIISAPFNITVQ